MTQRLHILTDYRDQFYFSTRYRGASVDVSRLRKLLGVSGLDVSVVRFADIDLRRTNYTGEWILYQSSEDPGLHYKDYIEDILLALQLQGAKLIPEFKYFRAHHNKVFMELLRDISAIEEVKNLLSRCFGTYEEYLKSTLPDASDALVLKPAAGTRSRGVTLLQTRRGRLRLPKRASSTPSATNALLFLTRLLTGKPFTPISDNRGKFIVQTFVPGLTGDYRILVYGPKLYVLHRSNRKGDFRASGSRRLDFEAQLPEGLLSFASSIYRRFDVPYMSLDIGYQEGRFYMFECQFLCLGQYTLEKSAFYYAHNGAAWERVDEAPDLEREIAAAVLDYITRH